MVVQPLRVRGGMPAEQRHDDSGDHEEDEVGLTEVRALEALRPHDLADHDGRDYPGKDHHDQQVDEPAEPGLPAEPRKLCMLVDRGDHRHQDRGQEHDEAVEDECVREAGHEPFEELALAEHDLDLVLHPEGNVGRLVVRPRAANLPDEELRAEQRAAADEDEQRAEDDRAYERTLRSSALIAGTISCRSPTTA